MAYLGEAKRNKYSFAHANDLILTEETQELYETTLDGGHIVHTSDVWAETVDYVADSTDADTFVTANPTIVHKYTLQNLTEVAGSNGQVWKIVDTGVWIKNWVNPAKQADTDGSAGVGWQAKLYQDDDTEVTPSEGRFWISYKTGTIHFEAGYTPSDRGYGTPKTTCYNYIGDMASAVIADDKVKVDTAATPDYIGAAYSDGVIRTDDATIGVTDGGNFITLAVKTDGINDTHINWGAGANQVDCDDLPIKQIGTPTWTTQCHYNQMFGSAGRATGGLITDATSANINVAGGTGFIKATDDDDVALLSFDWSASNGIAIPTGTTRYIGVEYGDPPVVVVKETNTWDYDTDFPLGVVVNNADALHILNNPWWVTDSITNLLERADCITGHVSRDICVGGLMIGDSADTNQYITMTAGKLWSRFNEFTISEIDTDPGGGGDDYVRAYRDAGTGYTYVTGQTTWDNAYWDDGTGTLNTLDSNKYGNLWLYLVTGGHIIVAYGWGQYTNSASAELEAPPTTVPPEVEEAGILLGRFIVQEGTTNAIAVDSAFTTQFTATQAADHSNLTGLAWTTAGHTATASTLAGFDGAGDAAEYTESNYSLVDGTRAFTGNVTIQGDLIIEDAGYIGSASDVDAIQIEADGDVVFSQDITVQSDIFLTDGHKIGITGSEPQLTFNSTDHDFEFKYGTVEILGSYPLRWRDLGDTVTYGYIRAISTDFTIESNVPMDIDMMDNSATALVISEGANAYATFSSLNGTESIVFAKTVTVPDGSLMATSAAPTTDAMIANKKYVDDQPVGVHTHDGDTLQLDAVNSDALSFAFNTGGTVTFNEAITMSAGKDLTIAGHILFNTNNSYIGFTSPRITFNDTDDQLDLTGTLVHANQSYMLEQAGAAANKDGYGQLWVKTATPNELWFTDDGGTSIQLNVAAGGTDVKVAVDAAATADYLGAAFSDGVLRADGTILTWTDGGDFATLGWASTGVGTTTWGSGSALTWTFDASAGTDTTVAFGDDTITVTAADFKTDGNLWLNGSNQELRFYEGANYIGFEAPALTGDQIYVLPAADGNVSDFLQTDGSGNLVWAAGGGGGMTDWIADADAGGAKTIADGETIDFAGGVGILTTNSGAGTPFTNTISFVSTEVNDTTWGDGGGSGGNTTWTIVGSGGNDVITFRGGQMNISSTTDLILSDGGITVTDDITTSNGYVKAEGGQVTAGNTTANVGFLQVYDGGTGASAFIHAITTQELSVNKNISLPGDAPVVGDGFKVGSLSSGGNQADLIYTRMGSREFGDGNLGDLTTSGNIVMTEDRHYHDLTNNHIIDTNGYNLLISGTLDNNGTIHTNGNVGAAGAAGSVAPTAGGAAVGRTAEVGGSGAGGAGGAAAGAGCGLAGGAGAAELTTPSLYPGLLLTGAGGGGGAGSSLFAPGLGGAAGSVGLATAGGAGGANPAPGNPPDIGASGGAGGSGGGVCIVYAFILDNTGGTISADGGAGGAGVTEGGAGTQSGNGGGGGGGAVVAYYATLTAAGTIQANGGAAGAGGNGGAAGSNGTVFQVLLS